MNEPITLPKSLTLVQYDECKARALKRVQSRIGEKPTRKQFKRELGSIWMLYDVILLVLFLAAFAVSSMHVINHMGLLATASYKLTGVGTVFGLQIDPNLYAMTHQIGFLLLAESAMIGFTMVAGLFRNQWPIRFGFYGLALGAGLFVLIANWQSSIGTLEAVLVPAVTIGLGVFFENKLAQAVKRRQELDARYIRALTIWEQAQNDPTKHPDYLPILRQEIWQKLTSLKANEHLADAPKETKLTLVDKELERDRWAYEVTPSLAPLSAA